VYIAGAPYKIKQKTEAPTVCSHGQTTVILSRYGTTSPWHKKCCILHEWMTILMPWRCQAVSLPEETTSSSSDYLYEDSLRWPQVQRADISWRSQQCMTLDADDYNCHYELLWYKPASITMIVNTFLETLWIIRSYKPWRRRSDTFPYFMDKEEL